MEAAWLILKLHFIRMDMSGTGINNLTGVGNFQAVTWIYEIPRQDKNQVNNTDF